MSLLLFTLSLTILFIKKLLSVHSGTENANSNSDNRILKTVTKTIILQITSSITQFILPLFLSIPYSNNEVLFYSLYQVDIGIFLDGYTNFLCIVMSYSFFNPLYSKLCGCIDKKCRICCTKWTYFIKQKQTGMHRVETTEMQTTEN